MLNERSDFVLNYKKNVAKDRAAKIIRIFSIPSLFVLMTLLTAFLLSDEIIENAGQFFISLFFLGIVPVLAYIVHALVPALRRRGRECQRNMAFAFTAVGYIAGIIYAFTAGVSAGLKEIFFGYFVSYVLLLVMNKAIKFRSSGHAAGIAGPLLYMVYFAGWVTLPVCAALYAVVFWASLRTKRHTRNEFIAGSLCSAAAFIISVLVI